MAMNIERGEWIWRIYYVLNWQDFVIIVVGLAGL